MTDHDQDSAGRNGRPRPDGRNGAPGRDGQAGNPPPAAPAKAPKPSKVEVQKEASNYLRGTIADGLRDESSDRFADGDVGLLKFHGTYQQYDRDERLQQRLGKGERSYSFMVRLRLPAGVMTAGQWLEADRLARAYGGGSIRLTTRQSIQFHGVVKGDLWALIHELNESLMATLGACGDVMRNVMCCPALPAGDPVRRAVQRTADEIAIALAPRSAAYHEIWIDGERVRSGADSPAADADRTRDPHDVEPWYGRHYLPRKFKMGIALPDDNCIDVYTQDCGFIALPSADGTVLEGYNMLVGGGLGMTHRKADTFARLATPAGMIAPDQAVDAVRTVIEIFRDFGDRADRRHARLKYVIEERGIEWFIEEFNRRAGFALGPLRELPPIGYQDHLGWADQGDGRFSYGLFVENGRLLDSRREAVRRAVETLRPELRITPAQNLLFTDIDAAARETLERILADGGFAMNGTLATVRRHAMACPALPTCGLALADAERSLPALIDHIEPLLAELGIAEEEIAVRMTGCPNGCARPYTADIAFVGRSPGVYDVYAGGRLAGDRLVDLLADAIAEDQIIPTLRPVLEAYAQQREPGEAFGDYWQRRIGRDGTKRVLTGAKDAVNPTIDGDPIEATQHGDAGA